MKKLIILRVDGGKVWGVSMGHLKRCLTIAQYLRSSFEILFVMKNFPDGVEFVEKSHFLVHKIDPADNSQETLIELCKRRCPQKIIFDLTESYFESVFDYCNENGIESIIFDSFGKCCGRPSALINDSFVPEFTKYPLVDKSTRVFLGPDFFIIDDPPSFVSIKEKVEKVLITLGGSDPAGLTEKILRLPFFDAYDISFHVVLGPLFQNIEKIKGLIHERNNITIHSGPSEFFSILSSTDIVITSAGRTLYEGSFLGRPAIVVPSIEHELLTAQEFSRLTGSTNIGLWADSSGARIQEALREYCDRFSHRAHISEKCRTLVDGNGLKRNLGIITGEK